MFRSRSPRAALATAALALALLGPLPSLADSEPPPPSESPMGVVLAVFCGAGISISRMAPGIPIVVVVTTVSCLGMFLDAFSSRDP